MVFFSSNQQQGPPVQHPLGHPIRSMHGLGPETACPALPSAQWWTAPTADPIDHFQSDNLFIEELLNFFFV